MNIATVRQRIATTLGAISDVQASPYALAQPTPPAFQILPPGVQYDRAYHRGLDEWTFTVQCVVAFTSDIGSQTLLDSLCAPTGSQSVKAVVEADPTLGGAVQSVRVVEQTPGQIVLTPGGDSPMLLVEWRLQILAN